MNHLLIAPIALPAFIAALTLLARRRRLAVARLLSIGSCLTLLGLALAAVWQSHDGAIQTYALGDWQAPFGIVLVLDRLSALMLLTVALLALAVLGHVIATSLDRSGWHFHPLFHFQLLGLNGAFLTGDLFNLFVFFEVLLIASYGLMLHGQGSARLQAGIHYVIINLVGSTLFLIAVGILYGVTGTLNMADLSIRVADAPAGDQGLIRAGAQLLIVVFALKAALLPLHLWLPRTYANSALAVAALFAIMTKVGAYSIIRVTTLVFGAEAGAAAWAPAVWMLPAALLTVGIGFIGLLAARRLRDMAAFAVIGSTGTLLLAVALFEREAMAAALYYLPHSTLAGAALFLIADLIGRNRLDVEDRLEPGRRFSGLEPLSLLFLLTAIALAGLPPLSGFVGKLLLLDAARGHAAAVWVWATILVTTFLGLVALGRAGSVIFWKSASGERMPPSAHGVPRLGTLAPTCALLAILGLITIFAGPVTVYTAEAAGQLFDPTGYERAVIGGREGASP